MKKRLILAVVIAICIVASAIVSSSQIQQDTKDIANVFIVAIGLIAAVVQIADSMGWLTPAEKKSNRDLLLQQVEENWVQPYLHDTLDEKDPFNIQLNIKPSTILYGQKFEKYKGSEHLPEVSSEILTLYKEANGQLLILGEPGSGKTFLLMQLAEHLIKEARQSERPPIPVVLNLSSWSKDKPEFETWLITELKRIYGVPEKQSKEWIKGNRLIYLLDGLDEVAQAQDESDEEKQQASETRQACVHKINAFRQAHDNTSIVVCSRIIEYGEISDILGLHGAIEMQPLTTAQIESYITLSDYPEFWKLYKQDEKVQDFAKIPFMLQTMMYSYRDKSVMQLELEEEEDRRSHLFNAYLQKRFQQVHSTKYFQGESEIFLSWLASKLIEYDDTVFYIEHLQPYWIDNPRTKRLYHRLLGLLFRVPVGVLLGVLFGVISGVISGAHFGMFGGVLIGVLFSVFIDTNTEIKIVDNLSFSLIKENVLFGVISGVLIVVFGGVLGEVSGGVLGGVLIGVLFGVLSGLKNSSNIHLRQNPNDGIWLSRKNGILGALFGVFFGVFSGVLIVVLWGVLTGVLLGVLIVVLFGMLFGMPAGLGAIIQHTILRYFLYQLGVAPLNYAEFLEYAVSAGFMRRIGSGFAFRHDYLRQYFASLNQEES